MDLTRRGNVWWIGLLFGWLCLSGEFAPKLQAEPLALKNQKVWFDSNGLAQAEQVWTMPQAAFQPVERPNFGFEKRKVWLKLTVPPSATPRLLALAFPTIDLVQLYDREARLVGQAGTLVPIEAWPHRARFPIFDLPPSPEPTEYLLHLDSEQALVLPLHLWDHHDLHNRLSEDFLWFGLVFGALVIMLFYNGVLYFMVRQRAYLYYLVGLAGFLLLALALEGFGLLYLWPPQIQVAMLPFGACLAQFGALGFARHFLRLPGRAERLDRLVKVAMGLAALLAVVSMLVTSPIVLLAVTTLTLPSLALILSLGVWAAFKRQEEAIFYLASWAVLALGSLATAAEPLLILPHYDWYRLAMYGGIILNLGLLSLGLSNQIRRLRAQKEQAQQEVLSAKEATINHLEEAQATKDRLLAAISHDLMTPIVGISGMVELILAERGNSFDGAMVRDLQLIYSNAARLNHLVADILDFTKMRHSKLQIKRQPVSLWKSAEFVVSMSQPLLSGRPVELLNEVPHDFPAVLADERRLQQVLFNLVENACKYSESGQICVRATELEDAACIEVADQGPGIDPNDWERLLLPFERGHSPEVQDAPGTGMGLALVHELVELHQSQLSCHPRPGGGTVIRFSLEYSPEQVETEKDPIGPQLPEIKNIAARANEEAMVLVVEDEPLAARLIERILEQNGFRPVAVHSGAEALETLSEEPDIDLVLLDVMMPHMDGFELCRLIRKEYSHGTLPILFLTARTDPEDIAKGFEVGGNDYIAKPVRHSELLARVNSQLRSKQLVVAMQENRTLQREVERRRRMEGLLKSMRTRLTRILDGIPSPFLVFDHRGQLSFLNSAAEQCCGFDLTAGQNIHFDELAEQMEFDQAMTGDVEEVSVQVAGGAPCWAKLHRLPQKEDSDAALILTLAQNGESSWPVHLGFQDAKGFLGSNDMKLLQETRLMPERLDSLQDAAESGVSPQDLAEKTAELMNSCLSYWNQYTGKDKLQLAEESGLWTVTAEASGTYRTRTLDRYLKSSTLPKRPRWRNVLQTAYFVRQNLPEKGEDRRLIDQQLEQLEGLLVRR